MSHFLILSTPLPKFCPGVIKGTFTAAEVSDKSFFVSDMYEQSVKKKSTLKVTISSVILRLKPVILSTPLLSPRRVGALHLELGLNNIHEK